MDAKNKYNSLVGYAIAGSWVAGLAGLLVGILGLIAGQWLAAGVSLCAAALAFGLLTNALLRS